MVKKLKKMAEQQAASPAKLLDSQLAGAVKASAQQIWLAGMGAFAKAQEEGGKVFEALVKEGSQLQRKTQAVAEGRLGEVTGKMTAMAGEVTTKAGASWDKLESIFESRTAKAMSKLGVPTAKDVAELSARIDALAAAVARLGAPGSAPAKRARATGQVATKTTAKTTTQAAARTSRAQPAAKTSAKPASQPAVAAAAPRKASAKTAAKKTATKA